MTMSLNSCLSFLLITARIGTRHGWSIHFINESAEGKRRFLCSSDTSKSWKGLCESMFRYAIELGIYQGHRNSVKYFAYDA